MNWIKCALRWTRRTQRSAGSRSTSGVFARKLPRGPGAPLPCPATWFLDVRPSSPPRVACRRRPARMSVGVHCEILRVVCVTLPVGSPTPLGRFRNPPVRFRNPPVRLPELSGSIPEPSESIPEPSGSIPEPSESIPEPSGSIPGLAGSIRKPVTYCPWMGVRRQNRGSRRVKGAGCWGSLRSPQPIRTSILEVACDAPIHQDKAMRKPL